MALEAEPRRGERQHAAELAAAEDPDRGFGLQNRRRCAHAPSFGCFGDAFGLALPPGFETVAERRVAQRQDAGGKQRRIDGAGRPMASVPTGMPGGICTME